MWQNQGLKPLLPASSIYILSITGLEIGLINMRLELNVKFYVYFKAL